MSNIAELLAQKEAIEQKIRELKNSERNENIAKVREMIAAFDISPEELFGKRAKAWRGKVAPKYRDPVSGKTWTGRGRAPRWLDGRNPEDFLIR